MRKSMVALAVAVALPITVMTFTFESSAEPRRERRQRLHQREVGNRIAVRQRQIESQDAIRANSLDPSGNYKGFADWARAALSPKDGDGQ